MYLAGFEKRQTKRKFRKAEQLTRVETPSIRQLILYLVLCDFSQTNPKFSWNSNGNSWERSYGVKMFCKYQIYQFYAEIH